MKKKLFKELLESVRQGGEILRGERPPSRASGAGARKGYDFSQAKRGPVVTVPPGKTRITIRLDEDLVEWFKGQTHAAGGGNYQTLINVALREYVEKKRGSASGE